ncbi:MAG: hypothetical protein AAF196_17740 [Planctomycetota bacterium]
MDKPIHLVLESGLAFHKLTIDGVNGPGQVTVSCRFPASETGPILEVTNCQAPVWVDGLRVSDTRIIFYQSQPIGLPTDDAIRIVGSSDVVLTNCHGTASVRGSGLSVLSSTVHVVDSMFDGGRGSDSTLNLLAQPGISAAMSTLYLTEVTATGGAGGILGPNPLAPGANGGPGCQLQLSSLFGRNLTLAGGSDGAGLPGTLIPGLPGQPLVQDMSSMVSQTTGPFHDVQFAPVATFGGPLDFVVGGPVGDIVALNFALDVAPVYLPLASGSILTGTPFASLALGVVPPGGSLTVPTTLPNFGPGLESIRLLTQVVALDASMTQVFTGMGRTSTWFTPGL